MATVQRVRLLVADDNATYRRALLELLRDHPRLEVVGEAADGEDVIRRAKELQPTLILMDINMPRLDGITATRRIKEHHKNITVIGLSVHADRDFVDAMINAGAVDLVPKEKAADDLFTVIERAILKDPS